MAGKKGRSGRKKSSNTLAREALEHNERMLPTYLEILWTITEDANVKDAVVIRTAKYLIDRSQGRVKAIHDLRFGRGTAQTADDLESFNSLLNSVMEEQKRLIVSLGKDVPESLTERNEIVKVLSITGDTNTHTVEAEFQLPSGNIERTRLGRV